MFKKANIPILFLIVFILSSVSAVRAWDDAGHKTIAYIAWQKMSPEAREKAFNVLMNAPEDSNLSVFYLQDSRSEAVKKLELFMIAATWADIVRDKKFKTRFEKYHHSNWHYSDTFWTMENGQIKTIENPNEEGGKAVEKLYEFEKVLKDSAASDADKAVALAWVLHLGGDIHQPLHTSARVTELEPKGDQGGNLFLLTPKDTPRERSENLHWFWDSILGRNVSRNDKCDSDYISIVAEMIMREYPFAEMQNRLEIGDYNDWKKESFQLATTDVFSNDLIRYETPSAKYRRNAFRVSEQQMALAGYRLGETLNRIFGGQASAENEIQQEDSNKNSGKYREQASFTGSTIGQGANDLWLWTKIRAALATTDELRDTEIYVDVENAVATLRGKVKSKEQKQKSIEAAKQVEGIKQIIDSLKISK